MHANRFSGLPECSLYPYPETGHAIVKYLIDHKLINDLLYRHMTSVNSIPRESPSAVCAARRDGR